MLDCNQRGTPVYRIVTLSVEVVQMTMTTTAPAPDSRGSEDNPNLYEIARSFEARILAAEDYLETERRIPQQLAEELYDAGVFRAFLPRELGGLECNPVDWLDAIEELSRINGSVGWLGMLHAGGTFASPEAMLPILAKDRWITAGNLGRAAGKAVRVPGGYRVSGKWPFCSGSPEANWLYGRSILYTEDGEQVTSPVDGNPWYITGYFPRSAVTLHDTWDGLGLRGTGSGHIEIKDVFIPRELVNERGVHFRVYDRPLYRAMFNVMAHGAHALGLAKAAMEEFTKLVHTAAGHGSLRQARLGNEQVHQLALGEADAMVRAARLFAWTATAEAYENAHHQSPVDYQLRVRLHQANTYAVQTAKKAIDLIFAQAGSPAVFRGSRLERIYRDISVAAQHTLVSNASLDRIGQYLLSKDLPGGPQVDTTGTGYIQGPHPQFAAAKLPKLPEH
jgi:alkylation response protein AidB-like acyl-CoA dehydrogenase